MLVEPPRRCRVVIACLLVPEDDSVRAMRPACLLARPRHVMHDALPDSGAVPAGCQATARSPRAFIHFAKRFRMA